MKSLKEKSINYRKKGYSYNMINQKLGVSKSTLSNWLCKIPYSPNKKVIERVGLAKLKSASFKHNQKINFKRLYITPSMSNGGGMSIV